MFLNIDEKGTAIRKTKILSVVDAYFNIMELKPAGNTEEITEVLKNVGPAEYNKSR